jgi:hypothetical protein
MQFNQFSFNNNSRLPKILRISSALILTWLFLVASCVIWSVTWQLLGSTSLAVLGASTANMLTFSSIPDFVLAKHGLSTINTAKILATQGAELQSSLNQDSEINLQPLIPTVQTLEDQIETLIKSWHQPGPSLLKPLISHKVASYKPGLEVSQLLATCLKYLQVLTATLNQPGEYLLLFQNADEIRATGGFLGSYARFSFYNGVVSAPIIRDIYEPAGQFTGYIPAPPGVQEYLSGGEGLQLQDANWSADFPTAAKTILSFFSLGNEQNINGVVAIHSGLITDILAILGPIYLPDYDASATAENFTELARADRENFFPGSKQKTFFLEHFFTQLKIKMSEASPEQLLRIISLLIQENQSYILAYHDQPSIQEKIEAASLSGSIQIPDNTELFLFPVESNVGINKANKGVQRTYRLGISENESSLRITFENNNNSPTKTSIRNPNVAESDHLHYVNYQRLLIEPDVVVTKITQGENKIKNWSEQIITTQSGTQLKEIGFLVIVQENTTSHVTISLAHPGKISSTTQVTIPFQPGLPSSLLQIETTKEVQQHTFVSDVTTVIAL